MSNTAISRLVVLVAASLFIAGGVCNLFANGTQEPSSSNASSKTVIEMWNRQFEDYQTTWRQKWVKKYNETHPSVQVNLTMVPADAWDQKIKAAQAVNKTPDIVHYAYNQVIQAAANEELQPMDQYINPKVLSDILPNVRKMVTYNGKFYAFPELVEPSMVLYYRKDLFSQAGLDPNSPPKTWAELLSDAKLLTTSDRYGLIIPFTAVELGWSTWGIRYGLTGHRIISDDWSHPLVTEKPYHDLAEFWANLYKAKVVPAQALSGYTDMQPFGQGKAAMALNGSWAVGQLKNQFPDLVPNVGVTNMPTPKGNYDQATATLGGWTQAIDAKSTHPKEAADFIAWLLGGDPAIKVDFFQASGFSKYPVRQSVADALKNDPKATDDPFMKVISQKIVPYAVAETIYPFDINVAFGHALERVYLQGMDVDQSLKQAASDIQDIINNKGLAGTNPNQ